MSVPVVILTGGSVAWYNDAFRDDVMGGRDVCLLPMSKVVPAFMPALAKEKTGQNIEFGGQRYSVYGSGVEAGDGLFVAYFVNNTTLKRQAGEYLATRPAVMLIAVDTYDEILKEMKESDRARVAVRSIWRWNSSSGPPQAFCGASAPRGISLWWKSAICRRSLKTAFPSWIKCARSAKRRAP